MPSAQSPEMLVTAALHQAWGGREGHETWLLTSLLSHFQADFSEINLVAHSTGSYSVDIDAIRNGHKVTK